MPASTLELRWFFSEPVPALVAGKGEFETRTDWYAPIADRTCSTKLREGAIELKFLNDESEVALDVGPPLALQQWEKVRQPLSANALKSINRFAPRHWLGFQKRRRTWAYREIHGQIRRCQSDDDGAIQVEWAHVTWANDSAWTFCIEGPAACGTDAITSTANVVANELRFDYRHFPTPASYPDFILQSQLQLRP